MTSATQPIGQGSGGSAAAVPAGLYERGRIHRHHGEQAELPGHAGRTHHRDRHHAEGEQAEPGGRGRSPALPGREPSPSPANLVRLPGQEGVGDSGPRRPLISGGAFTLAVAIGLALDQSTQPESLEPATPTTTGGAPAGGGEQGSDETGVDGLTEEEQEVVEELRARDAEVRRHEAAHAAAGGQYAGSPTFSYQTGPDGRQYAVGGEVSIDTAPVEGDPEATIRKAQQIKAAATAPAEPSSQDRRVAAQADSLRQQAQAALAAEKQEERQVEEAEAAEAEAVRAQQQAARDPAPAPDPAPEVAPEADPGAVPPAGGSEASSDGTPDGTPDGGAGLAANGQAGASGFVGAEAEVTEDEREQPPPFAAAAFSAAAASYRGAGASPRLVSIAI